MLMSMLENIRINALSLTVSLGAAVLLCSASPPQGETASPLCDEELCGALSALGSAGPSLGDAELFAILAGSTVAATLVDSVIFGHVGVAPGPMDPVDPLPGIPGLATLMPSYRTHVNDAAAIAAQVSALDLYTTLKGIPGATTLSAALGGRTLNPGVYACPTTAGIVAGQTLTLDGAGLYIFQIGTALTTATLSKVVLINGASADQIFWQCGTAVTLGGRLFYGNVVAGTAITVDGTADVYGRLFAPTSVGTVTLAGSNTINGVDDPGADPALCAAESFAVLGGTAVLATLPGTSVHGDLGVSAGTVLPGFPTVVAPYGEHANDAKAIAAQVSASALKANLLGTRDAVVLGHDLGGLTLNPGVYTCLTTAGIAAGGTLTLDGDGFYIFQIGTTLTTAGLSNVILMNGATSNKIFWQCGTTASFSGEIFYGTVVSGITITLAANADLDGRLLAPYDGSELIDVRDRTAGGTVTMAGGNTINVPDPLDVTIGCNYCSSPVNSTGQKGQMSASGSILATASDLTLTVTQVPNGHVGFVLASQTQGLLANPGGSMGNMCLGGNLARFNRPNEISLIIGGSFSLVLPLHDFPEHPNFGVTVMAGDSWNFQFWHRDMVDGISTSNFSNALEVVFQ
jgi:hypothetical protein